LSEDDSIGGLMQRVNKQRAPEDGLGWLLDYVCRLMSAYPSFTEEFVWDKLEMSRGWAYYAWAHQNEAQRYFVGWKMLNGYVRAESEKLVQEAKDFWAKQEK